ncbi:MAG: SpoIIE family protein phosphatase [Acidimicrobiia bacterium]
MSNGGTERVITITNDADRLSFLDLLVAQSPLGIAFFDLDRRYQIVNEQLADIMGVRSDDLIGRQLGGIVASQAERSRQIFEQIQATNAPVRGVQITDVTPADPAPHTWFSSWYPVHDPDTDTTIGVACIVHDITEQARYERLRVLAVRLMEAATTDQILAATLEHLSAEAGTDDVGIWAADSADATMLRALARGTESTRTLPQLEVDTESPLCNAFRSRRMVQVRGAHELQERFPNSPMLTMHPPVECAVAVPLREDGRVFGVLAAMWSEPGALDDGMSDYVETLGTVVQGAVIRLLGLERERTLALEFQEAFLPAGLPSRVDGFELSGRYEAAENVVGGDFYDAFELADGRLALVLGDVAGHGIKSAALMAETRYRVNTLLHEHSAPRAVMTAVNAMIGDRSAFITLVIAIADPVRRVVTWSSAGHSPPLLIAGSSHVRVLDSFQPGRPIGLGGPSHFTEDSASLRAGDTLLFYSDGLIERRNEGYEEGEQRLIRILEDMRDEPIDRLIDTLVARCPPPIRFDDLCVLVARFSPSD